MTKLPGTELPVIENDTCWYFTCKDKPTAYDPLIFDGIGVLCYVPVCACHKIRPCRGKVGMFTMGEMKWLKRFERIIRFFGRRADKKR